MVRGVDEDGGGQMPLEERLGGIRRSAMPLHNQTYRW